MDRHEVERIRRSLAMLSPGAPCGWTREQAIEVLEHLADAIDNPGARPGPLR